MMFYKQLLLFKAAVKTKVCTCLVHGHNVYQNIFSLHLVEVRTTALLLKVVFFSFLVTVLKFVVNVIAEYFEFLRDLKKKCLQKRRAIEMLLESTG